MEIRVQYVGNDGTYVLDGHRVRSAPGNGDGSLRDEYFWDIRTPIAGDRSMKLVLSCVSDPKLKAFVRSLPIARMVPAAVPVYDGTH